MSLLRKGILVFGGQACGIALSVTAGMLFSRVLGPDGMGQLDLFRSTSTVASAFLALGIGQASIYLLNNRKVPLVAIVCNSVKMALVLGLLLAAGLTVAVFLMPDYFGLVPAVVAVVFAAGAACSLGANMLRPILVAQLAARRMVAADLLPPALFLVGGLLLWVAGWMQPGPAIAVMAASGSGATVLLLGMLWPHVQLTRPFDWPLLGQSLVYGVKLAASNILYVMSLNVTLMLLRALLPDSFEQVGLYSRAVSVCNLIILVPVAMMPLLYAKWSGMAGHERSRQSEMAMRLNMSYGLVSGVGVLLAGKYLIWILYGAKFLPAEAALWFLAPAVMFAPMGGVCSNLLYSDGRALVMAWILAGTVFIVAATTYLAVGYLKMGFQGAALAALAGNAFTAAGGMVACWRLYGLRPLHCLVPSRSDVRYVLAALGLAAAPEGAARRKKSG